MHIASYYSIIMAILHNINIIIQNRGYKWPIEKFVPDTPGWDRLMRRRFDQVRVIVAYD